ncbi:MAG: MerR family transcriptional regulator [Nannocystaceae bacterium]|nr:MerR family transcriptional regulator [bacterium]
MSKKALTVADVAKLSGVTIRALHHYDEIGLLSPTRGSGGYRRYSEADVLRLQQILIYRALGLPLQRIKAVMDDPDFDVVAALQEQRTQLEARAAETSRMLESLDRALTRLRGNTALDLSALFDGFDPALYEEEAEQRWGSTAAYAESKRRTSQYTRETWARINAEADAIGERVAKAIEAGVSPTSEAGKALAEAKRLHVDRYYYPCGRRMFQEVASLYTDDPRFRQNLDRFGAGAAAFLRRAAAANARDSP